MFATKGRGMSRSKPIRRRHWMIARCMNGRTEIFTVVSEGGTTVLPVFSFEEEARLFLCCEAPADGWRVRETSPGELTSVLYGPCPDVKTVALDPLPEFLGEGMMNLVSLERSSFLKVLLEDKDTHGRKTLARPLPKSRESVHRAGSAVRG